MNEKYDRFIRNGLAVGFTDDQIDFLYDFIFCDLERIKGREKNEKWEEDNNN